VYFFFLALLGISVVTFFIFQPFLIVILLAAILAVIFQGVFDFFLRVTGGRVSTPKILGALGLPTGELEERLHGFEARNRPLLQIGRDVGAAGLGAIGSGGPTRLAKDAPPDIPALDLDNMGFPKVYVKGKVFAGQSADDPTHAEPSIGGYKLRIERGKEMSGANLRNILEWLMGNPKPSSKGNGRGRKGREGQ
jgi:hypothetical protein